MAMLNIFETFVCLLVAAIFLLMFYIVCYGFEFAKRYRSQRPPTPTDETDFDTNWDNQLRHHQLCVYTIPTDGLPGRATRGNQTGAPPLFAVTASDTPPMYDEVMREPEKYKIVKIDETGKF